MDLEFVTGWLPESLADYRLPIGVVMVVAANVLVLGGSGGYGLASRIVTGFGAGARTLCLSFEKEPAEDRTGTAGWYNNRAFDRAGSCGDCGCRPDDPTRCPRGRASTAREPRRFAPVPCSRCARRFPPPRSPTLRDPTPSP